MAGVSNELFIDQILDLMSSFSLTLLIATYHSNFVTKVSLKSPIIHAEFMQKRMKDNLNEPVAANTELACSSSYLTQCPVCVYMKSENIVVVS